MAADPNDKVCLAVLKSHKDLSSAHYDSMLNFLNADGKGTQRVAIAGKIQTKYSASGGIHQARNEVVKKFLDDESFAEVPWLWWCDSDMLFAPMALEILLAMVDPEERPIVGGLAFSQRSTTLDEEATPLTSWAPTIYAYRPTDDRYVGIHDFPRNVLMQVGGTGAAFMVIHRSVLERMREKYGDHWYSPWKTTDDELFGEDLSFSRRCLEMDIPMFVHTGATTGHHKSTYGNLRTWDQENQHLPIVAVIPVKDKLKLTQDLVTDLLRQNDVTDVLVLDNGSTDGTKQWLEDHPDERVLGIDSTGKNIHEMWNYGLDWAKALYGRACVLVLNNDLEIGPNFGLQLRKALYSAWDIWAVCPNYDDRPGTGRLTTTDICAGRYDGTGGFAGFAMALRAEVEYRFPEKLQWWYGDNDLIQTIYSRGYRAVIDLDTKVEHLDGGGQTGGDWSEMSEAIQQDKQIYEEKWS